MAGQPGHGRGTEAVYAADNEAAVGWLAEHLRSDDVLLVKASRGARLDEVAAAVLADTRGAGGVRAILLSGGLALVFTLIGTVGAIRLLSAKGYGQLIRDDGPTTHHTKRGTPTMGGTVIIGSVVLAYLLSALLTSRVPTASGLLLLFLLVGLGLVGFLDNYIKVAKQRSLGLRSRAKMTGQVLVAIVFGLLALRFPTSGVRPRPRATCPSPVTGSPGRCRPSWSCCSSSS